MTADVKRRCEDILRTDTNEQLVARFAWYVQNFNPIDEDRCDHYEMVKAEMLRRMEVRE